MSLKRDVILDGTGEWREILDTPLLDAVLTDIAEDEARLAPPASEIFAAFKTTPYSACWCVIVGQDPYYNGAAHGYAFSSTDEKIPASLRNIYGALQKSGEIDSPPKRANLVNWSYRGVLLLNRALTTRLGTAMAHSTQWDNYVNETVREILRRKREAGAVIVVMLWGKEAQKLFVTAETEIKQHIVMFWDHPVAGMYGGARKFDDCPHFADANKLRINAGLIPLDWHPDSPIDYASTLICTDGSAIGNGRSDSRGGWCFIMYELDTPYSLDKQFVKKSYAHYGRTPTYAVAGTRIFDYGEPVLATNNRSEGFAILFALWRCETIESHVVIATDSEYWFNIITKWLWEWIRDGRLSEQKNLDIVRALYTAINNRKGSTSFRHVISHVKKPDRVTSDHVYSYVVQCGNDLADTYAKQAVTIDDFETKRIELN